MRCSICRLGSARIRQSFCSTACLGMSETSDLARAMQRAGWAVITFHYRGSWGSGGNFTLRGGCADVDALLLEIEGASGPEQNGRLDPPTALSLSVIATVASSRRASARYHPELAAIGLIAPWDISYDAREFAKLSPKQADARASTAFNDVDGRLEGATALSLMRIIRSDGAKLRLIDMAPALGGRPLLLAVATRDDPDDQGGGATRGACKAPL